MADFAIRWADFSGGDHGVLDPARADSDSYYGSNVYVYDSGLLGVRAGAKILAATGLPTHTVAPGPMGFAVHGSYLIIAVGNLYRIPMSASPAATMLGAYPSPATTPVTFAEAANNLYSLLDGVLYKHTGGSTDVITTPEPLSSVVRWGNYLVGVDENVPWRIWFSTVNSAGPDFDTWGANDFYFVGGNEQITAMRSILDTLYIGKPSGWWAVSGVLGIAAQVRQVSIGNGPIDNRRTSVTTDNRIAYWPNEQVPALFNGERPFMFRRQRMRQPQSEFPSQAVVVTPQGQKLVMAGDSDADEASTDVYVLHEGRWSYHSFDQAIGGLVPYDVQVANGMPTGVIFSVRNPTTVGNSVVISSFKHDLDRPAHVDDEWAAPIDPGSDDLVQGSVSLPAWYDGQGRQVRVRTVIVQFRKWASGSADTLNRLHVKVTPQGQYEAGAGEATTKVWTEPSSLSPTDGADWSLRINVMEQGYGNGFRIEFPVMAGVALREVVALVDVGTTRT